MPAGHKYYPRVEEVPFPGRTTPVAVVIKLAVPQGFERDLAGDMSEDGGCMCEGERVLRRLWGLPPTTRAAGAVDPGDATIARKVRTMCTGFAKCTGDD